MSEIIEQKEIEKHSKYFFIACFIGVIILSVLVIRSYVVTIISSILLSYIFFPVYARLKTVVRSENVASVLTAAIVVLAITIPVVFAANALINESIVFFHKSKTLDFSKLEEKIPESFRNSIEVNEKLKEMINRFSLTIARAASDFLVALPKKILDFFVMIFIMFYMFKEGKSLVEKIKDHIPLKESHKRDVMIKFNGVVYASIYGIVLTGMVQGTVGAVGLWIFGVPSPVLWGGVMIILSMLPFVGAFLVWFPAAMYKLVTGDIANGIGLMLYGLLIVSTIDNIVRPKIVGSRGNIHPVLVLLGIVGGLELFGILGMIIGPLILAILTVFLGLYADEREKR
ncbi:MAG: AI-2E family transporter [Nanoarchaeota archaeon]